MNRRRRKTTALFPIQSRIGQANKAVYTSRKTIPGCDTQRRSFLIGDQFVDRILPVAERAANTIGIEYTSTNGVLMLLGERASQLMGTRVDSVTRRLYDLRVGRQRSIDLGFADACFLAFDEHLDDHDVHVLPGIWACALELAYGDEAMADELMEVARAFNHRPDRPIACTAEAFELIGGEPSRWIRPSTGPSANGTFLTTAGLLKRHESTVSAAA